MPELILDRGSHAFAVGSDTQARDNDNFSVALIGFLNRAVTDFFERHAGDAGIPSEGIVLAVELCRVGIAGEIAQAKTVTTDLVSKCREAFRSPSLNFPAAKYLKLCCRERRRIM